MIPALTAVYPTAEKAARRGAAILTAEEIFLHMNSDSQRHRLPSLDGWRALSIGLVLGCHSMYTAGFPQSWAHTFEVLLNGNLGVRFFFFISGLLITWLLLREKEANGEINLVDFYIRRALRILPVYWAFLAVVAVICRFTPIWQSEWTWLGNLAFATDYANPHWITSHLWSLAVEEQFYLLWPFSLAWLLRRRPGTGTLASLLAATAVLAAFSRWMGYVTHYDTRLDFFYEDTSFFNYIDTLAAGCAAGAVLRYRPHWFEPLRARPVRWGLLGLTLLGLPNFSRHILHAGDLLIPLGPIVQAAAMMILVIQSILLADSGLYRLLNLPFVCRIGVLSYSIYIWQALFCTPAADYGLRQAWWLSFPLWLVPVFVVATLSYYGFERPFLELRARLRRVAVRNRSAQFAGDLL